MAFDFPSAPAVDETFTDTVSGAAYKWSGEAWNRVGSGSAVPPPTGNYVFRNGLTLDADGVTVDLDPATASLIGGLTEPPADGLPYARTNSAAGVASWVPATKSVRPTVTSVIPEAVGLSDPTQTVRVLGADFTATSVVSVGLNPMPTTFVSATEVTFELAAGAASFGTYALTVTNGDVASLPPISFYVLPNPTIASLVPTTAVAGTPITLRVNGDHFEDQPYAATVVTFDGVDQVTTYGGSDNVSVLNFSPLTTQVQVRNGTILAGSAPVTFTAT